MEDHIGENLLPPISDAVLGKPPPAGWRAIQNLSFARITSDDLLGEMSKECLICLEKHIIGALACKLACGHMYHHGCIVKWLQMHCTCPVCRYELQTDDVEYESNRRRRMFKRSMRFRIDELRAKKVSQLKEVASCLLVNLSGCIDKGEIIERLLISGRIQIIEGAPAIVKTKAQFEALSVADLKMLLLSFGLSRNGALEKSELQSRLLKSGRIEIEGDCEDGDSNKNRHERDKFHSREDYGHKARNDDSKIMQSHIICSKFNVECDCSTADSTATHDASKSIDEVIEARGEEDKQCTENSNYSKKMSATNDTSYSCSAISASTVRTDITGFLQNCSSGHSKGASNDNSKDTCSTSYCYSKSSSGSYGHYANSLPVGKETDVRNMSVAELRQLCALLSVSTINCLYKGDIVDRLLATGRITLSSVIEEKGFM